MILAVDTNRLDDRVLVIVKLKRVIIRSFSAQDDCLWKLCALEMVSRKSLIEKVDVSKLDLIRESELDLNEVSHCFLLIFPELKNVGFVEKFGH